MKRWGIWDPSINAWMGNEDVPLLISQETVAAKMNGVVLEETYINHIATIEASIAAFQAGKGIDGLVAKVFDDLEEGDIDEFSVEVFLPDSSGNQGGLLPSLL